MFKLRGVAFFYRKKKKKKRKIRKPRGKKIEKRNASPPPLPPAPFPGEKACGGIDRREKYNKNNENSAYENKIDDRTRTGLYKITIIYSRFVYFVVFFLFFIFFVRLVFSSFLFFSSLRVVCFPATAGMDVALRGPLMSGRPTSHFSALAGKYNVVRYAQKSADGRDEGTGRGNASSPGEP